MQRIRLAPQKDWEVNQPDQLARVLKVLEQIQSGFNAAAANNKKISLADLIVLAGGAAIEKAAKDAGIDTTVPFTPGRTDASQDQTDADSFAPLEPKIDAFRSFGLRHTEPVEVAMLDKAQLMRLTAPELTTLVGGLRVLNINHGGAKYGVFTERPETLTNDFFVNLLDMKYTWKPTDEGQNTFEARDPQVRRGQVDRDPCRPRLRLERPTPRLIGGLRLRRLPHEVRHGLRQRMAQDDEPRPLRHHPHRLTAQPDTNLSSPDST